MKNTKPCLVGECQKVGNGGRGYCYMHYARLRTTGELGDVTPMNERHGLSSHPVYHVWRAMKQRCYNPNDKGWKNYGGRGIKVCERWQTYGSFRDDMGERPAGASVERRDVNGDYCPENCYWSDRTTQSVNRRLSSVNTSGLRGIHRYRKRWVASIGKRYSSLHIGVFDTPEEAAWMYDQWAIALYGDVAPLNFIYK